eukprot:14558422-Alexandrium_andersonii.AAC.1
MLVPVRVFVFHIACCTRACACGGPCARACGCDRASVASMLVAIKALDVALWRQIVHTQTRVRQDGTEDVENRTPLEAARIVISELSKQSSDAFKWSMTLKTWRWLRNLRSSSTRTPRPQAKSTRRFRSSSSRKRTNSTSMRSCSRRQRTCLKSGPGQETCVSAQAWRLARFWLCGGAMGLSACASVQCASA